MPTPGVSTTSGASSGWRQVRRRGDAARSFGVGEVVAVLAAHELVLARSRRREEVARLLAAHDPGLRLDEVRLEAAALEDPLVRLFVRSRTLRRARPRRVERVRVLHDELAQAQEAAPRAAARRAPWSRSGTRPAAAACSDWISRARNVIDSSCVHESTNGAAAAVLQVEEDRDVDAAASSPRARPASASARASPGRRSR